MKQPKFRYLMPTIFPEAQSSIAKKLGEDGDKTNEIPIHVTPDGETAHITSCWYASLMVRLKILFTGRIWIVIHHTTMVPISVLDGSPMITRDVEKEVL